MGNCKTKCWKCNATKRTIATKQRTKKKKLRVKKTAYFKTECLVKTLHFGHLLMHFLWGFLMKEKKTLDFHDTIFSFLPQFAAWMCKTNDFKRILFAIFLLSTFFSPFYIILSCHLGNKFLVRFNCSHFRTISKKKKKLHYLIFIIIITTQFVERAKQLNCVAVIRRNGSTIHVPRNRCLFNALHRKL